MEEEEGCPNEETRKLFDGVENGDEELVKALLLGNKNKQFELDINFQDKKGKYGWTALHMAAWKGFEQIVKILLEHGSNVDLQTPSGMTALHIAAHNGFEQIVKILIEHGSNVNLQNSAGMTALHYAASFDGFEQVVKILIEHGSNVKLQNSDGKTARVCAENQDIVELIVQLQGRTIKPARGKKEN